MRGVRLGPYRLLDELGSGGMGSVHLAEVEGEPTTSAGLATGQRVALKVIHGHLLETPGFFKRFLREAEIGRAVDHENVVRTYDCDATLHAGHQLNYLVMEYVQGQTLRDLLLEMRSVPEELCRHIGREVARGLAAIHAVGVVHRDLKPENVLISPDDVVKVMDLGVARLQDEAIRLSQAGSFVGSVEYAAPEQFRGGRDDADPRSDLHALGVVLYELSTGQHPFREEQAVRVFHRILEEEPRPVGELNPQLSPFFEEVVRTLIRKDPEERFKSAAELLTALEEGEESPWWEERARALRRRTRQPLRRVRIPRETALYGRDDDLEQLTAMHAQLKAGVGQVVLIEGEAGIGKTRLVDEFVGRLQQQGEPLNFLFGSYPPGGAATATGAFSKAFREQFGTEGLEEVLHDRLPDVSLLVPAFAALLRGDVPPTGAEPLSRDSLQAMFLHATRGLCAERPTIVLIDDLHFAPAEGLALFASLAVAAPGLRLLLVGTYRHGLSGEWMVDLDRATQASRMHLARLGAKDLTLLLKDSFQSQQLAERLGYRIAEKSDGNPFFALEIVRSLREARFIERGPDGTWNTTQQIPDIQVPGTVMDLIQARLLDLSEEEQELLDVASCCGFEFDPELVAEVVELRPIPALRAFGRLERAHRLVRSKGRRFAFDHHQVQEALYGGQSEPLRREYHARIATVLEARAGAVDGAVTDLDDALCRDLCSHFLLGSTPQRGVRYLARALDYLEESYLNDKALALADRALGIPDLLDDAERLEVLHRKARLFDLLGRRKEQEEALQEVIAIAEAMGDKAAQARAHRRFGWFQLAVRRPAEARPSLELARDLAQEIGDLRLEAVATGNLGIVHSREGRHEKALEHHERHLEIARQAGARDSQVYALGNIASMLTELGRKDEAIASFKECLELAAEVGSRRDTAVATVNLSLTYSDLGRLGEAHEAASSALEICREIGFRLGVASVSNAVGAVLAQLGRSAECATLQTQAIEQAEEIGAWSVVITARMTRAIALRQMNHDDEARGELLKALTLADEHGDELRAAEVCLDLADAFVTRAEPEVVQRYLERSLELAKKTENEVLVARALAFGAEHAGGDVAEAVAAWEAVRGRLPAAVQLELRHRLWQLTGDVEHLTAAKRCLDGILEHTPDRYRAGLLEHVGPHRALVLAWKDHLRQGGA